MKTRTAAIVLILLVPQATMALEPQISLVTKKPIGRLAVAGLLDIDLHAQFMVSRTFDKDTALNWYNCGRSGGGSFNEVGGSFGDFGLHVPHDQRADKYPHWVSIDKVPAVRFDGNDMMKGNFPVEEVTADTEDFALEIWVRDESISGGEVVLGWQSEDGKTTSAPLSLPAATGGSKNWRHIVINCTADKEMWHIDNKPLPGGPRRMLIQKGHRMVLGGASSAKPSFKGELAAVRLHEKAMTAEQIAHNFKGGVMLGTELHSWWRMEEEQWWSAESEHFRHCVDKKEMAGWDEKKTAEFHERVPKMFKTGEECYHLYGERLALRMSLVSTRPEFRGDGIKYKIPIQPSKGSWMGWDKNLGFGWGCQGAGYFNPHELVHGCQAQSGGGIEGNYWEAHANFPQIYLGIYQTLPPDTASVSMLFPANGRNYYHDRLMFEHLAQTPEYGPMFISKMWYDAKYESGKHAYPWVTFTKLDPDPSTPLDYEWMRMVQKCVTWDFETFDKKTPNLYAHSANRQKEKITRFARTYLEPMPFEEGWWRAPQSMVPQQLGYNICPLKVAGARVSVQLAGDIVNEERGSDWRAAFVAVDSAGKPSYSRSVGVGAALDFDCGQAKELYLVVCAIPKKIMSVHMTGDYRSPEQERFPYKVKLKGCEPLDLLRPVPPTVAGAKHANGGGFVAATAKVDPTAYIGPDAQVLGNAKVLGNARIEDYAVVMDNATVSDSAQVSGYAQIGREAVLRDQARLRDYAVVKGRTIVRERARILEHATADNAKEISGDATLKGIAAVGGTVTGSAILEGHYAKTNPITRGAWFTWSWSQGKNPGELDQELGGLQAQYAFENSHLALAWDTHGASHAYLRGKPAIVSDPARTSAGKGAVLVLNGRDQYLEFPRSVVDLQDMTIDLHVQWDGGTAGQRIIECRGSKESFFYLTPSDTDGKLAFVMRKGGIEQSLKAPPLHSGAWTRVQVNLTGDTGRLSVDGKPVAENPKMTMNPEDVRPTLCLIGRGASSGFFKGRLDDVSIYCNATPTQEPASSPGANR